MRYAGIAPIRHWCFTRRLVTSGRGVPKQLHGDGDSLFRVSGSALCSTFQALAASCDGCSTVLLRGAAPTVGLVVRQGLQGDILSPKSFPLDG